MNDQIKSNPLLDKLPPHLKQFMKSQDYEQYTPINQAVWRYVMRKNVDSLSKVAHESYLEGLDKTGISIDYIPSMYGMNRILKEIGWAAVALMTIFEALKRDYPSDWLLSIEIYELTKEEVVLQHLINLKDTWPKIAHLIDNGIDLINRKGSSS